MVELRAYKVNSKSKATHPNSIFFVKGKNDSEMEVYVTSANGFAVPLKGIKDVISSSGNITVTGTDVKNINIAPSLLAIIQNAISAGDPISSLLNDAGYITINDVPVFNPSDYDLDDFNNLSSDPFLRQSDTVTTVLSEDVLATVETGAIEAGETIPQGTDFTQFVKKLLQKIFSPTFVAPFATLTSSVTGTREIGDNINTTLTVTFNRGQILGTLNLDGTWNPTGVQNFRAGVANTFVIDGNAPQAGNSLSVNRVIISGANSFNASVNHAEGVQPTNSLNQPFDIPLPAGTVNTNTITITGRLRQFFGSTSSVPSTSAQVRALPSSNFDNVNQFNLATGTVNTIFVVAIPATKSITQVIDLGNLNVNITSQYVLTDSSFIVNDIGGTPRTYKLYVMQVGTPYAVTTNHQITLA